MPQSLARVWLHVTFSTKDRRPYLQHDDFRTAMFKILAHHVEAIGCVSVIVGGWHDHIHIVCGLSRTVTISSLVEHIKTETSKWAKHVPHGVATFAWQAGYAVFSVSQSNLQRVIDYVEHQATHHATKAFQDELRELCHKHGIEIDEQYMWD
ncbi:MAG: transposase [Planctomycetota bacterium]|nr:transposase [Planctomycetota bacterium]MDA1214189.1 transposase [Planctomycetota bacterium]